MLKSNQLQLIPYSRSRYLVQGDATKGPVDAIVPAEGVILPEAKRQQRPFRLKIFHLNDLHGNVVKLTRYGNKPVFSRMMWRVNEARRRWSRKENAANLVHDPPLAHPAALFVIKGIRVGLIGLATPAQIKCSQGNFQIVDPVETVNNLLPAMRPLCDVLIILSHLDYSLQTPSAEVLGAGDVELANNSPPVTFTEGEIGRWNDRVC